MSISGTARMAVLASMALVGQEVSASWGLGFCDPFGPNTLPHFEPARYEGNWYEI